MIGGARFSAWWAMVAVLGLALFGTACAEEAAPETLTPGFGRLVAREGIHVVPSRHWTWQEDHWQFHVRGGLHVRVASLVDAPLRITLKPTAGLARFGLDVAWDGEILPPLEPIDAASAWEIEIGPERLGEGLHELRLERDYKRDERRYREEERRRRAEGRARGGEPRAGLETELLAVELTHGDRRWALAPDRIGRYDMLRDFLLQGIAGPGQDQYGGVLFDGPGAWELELGSAGALRLDATAVNASATPARFRASWTKEVAAEVEVPAGEASPLSLEAPSRGGVLRIEVEGAEDGLFLLGEPFVVTEAAGARPNLVLVSLDTTRRDAVAPYDPQAPTPNLAAFARTATVFTDAHATAPWTLPSHASMLTGLWPGEHRASIDAPHLPFEQETLPERLRASGYFTAGFAGGYLCHHRFGLGQGMHRYRDPDGFETTAQRLTDSVLGFLDARAARPLFLFVNYFDPHALFQAPAPFQEALDVARAAAPLADHPIWGPITRGEGGTLADAIRRRAEFSEPVREYLRRAYRAEVAYMDAQVGRLFDRLQREGVWDNSLVVVVADHGELLGEGGYFTHGHRLDPELTEIPLMIKWPGQTEGTVVDELVSQVDLFPTLLRAARLPIPAEQHGLLLHPQADRNLRRRPRVFMEEHETGPHPLFDEMKVAADLYGVQERERRELYWESERRCFARSQGWARWEPAECPAAGLSLAQLEALLGHHGDRDEVASGLTPEEEEGLRALGYL